MGRLSLYKGNVASVWPMLEESLRVATDLEDKSLIALVLISSGGLALVQGNYESACAFQKDSLKLFREVDNKWGVGAVLQTMGVVELNQGNLELAGPLLEECLTQWLAVGETLGVASVQYNLGRLAYRQGNYRQARAWWQESLSLQQEIGYSSTLGYSMIMLGWVALREGKVTEASDFLRRGLYQGLEVEAVQTIYWGLAGLAALEQARQQAERAALLFGATEALSKARNIEIPPFNQVELDQEIAAAQAQLDGERWDRAYSRGYSTIFEITGGSEEKPRRLDKKLADLLETVDI